VTYPMRHPCALKIDVEGVLHSLAFLVGGQRVAPAPLRVDGRHVHPVLCGCAEKDRGVAELAADFDGVSGGAKAARAIPQPARLTLRPGAGDVAQQRTRVAKVRRLGFTDAHSAVRLTDGVACVAGTDRVIGGKPLYRVLSRPSTASPGVPSVA
jgi:hypothetical protein